MKSSEETLVDEFQNNIDEITDLAISSFGLALTRDSQSDSSSSLLRWLDFTSRYISPVPRIVLKSPRFPMALPTDAANGLHKIVQMLESGQNVNPYQGKGLTKFDTENIRRQIRTDALWAEWKIHHLHLTSAPLDPNAEYSERSGWLLFLMVYDNAALLIDVREHGENNLFSLNELVETFIQSWPDDAARYLLKGVIGLSQPSPTDAERGQLRSGGVSSMIELDGKVYIGPGCGVTTASTSTFVSLRHNRIRSDTRLIAKEVARADGQFVKAMTAENIISPDFKINFVPRIGLGIFEENSKRFWSMPRNDANDSESLFPAFHNIFIPAWSEARISQYLETRLNQ